MADERQVEAAALAIQSLERLGAASYRQMAIVALEAARNLAPSGELGCADCGRPYSRGPDLVVGDDDWKRIAPRPDGGGVLCPNCMNDRFEKIGATAVAARFTSGPFAAMSTEVVDVKAMREFIERQSDKLSTIEGSISWRNGYGAALDAMSRVLDAIAEKATVVVDEDQK